MKKWTSWMKWPSTPQFVSSISDSTMNGLHYVGQKMTVVSTSYYSLINSRREGTKNDVVKYWFHFYLLMKYFKFYKEHKSSIDEDIKRNVRREIQMCKELMGIIAKNPRYSSILFGVPLYTFFTNDRNVDIISEQFNAFLSDSYSSAYPRMEHMTVKIEPDFLNEFPQLAMYAVLVFECYYYYQLMFKYIELKYMKFAAKCFKRMMNSTKTLIELENEIYFTCQYNANYRTLDFFNIIKWCQEDFNYGTLVIDDKFMISKWFGNVVTMHYPIFYDCDTEEERYLENVQYPYITNSGQIFFYDILEGNLRCD
jgi:hypothetical protein